jgi:hypothetical protein
MIGGGSDERREERIMRGERREQGAGSNGRREEGVMREERKK